MEEQLSFDLNVQTADAVKNVDTLIESIDKLSTSVEDNVKVGADMAKGLEDVSVETKGLVASISDLVKVIADQTKASEEQTVATEENTASVKEAIVVQAEQIKSLQETVAALNEVKVANEEAAAAEKTRATATKGATAATAESGGLLTKLSSLGTPEVLKAGTWGILAAGGVAYEAIKKYSEFNAILTQSITQAGRAPNSLPFLTSTAMTIARQTGENMSDVANMMYRVSSATANWNNGLGASNKQLAQMTRQVANLNVLGGVAGGAPSEQSARIMGAVMNANLQGVGNNSSNAAAWVNASVGAGDIKQSEFISAMGRGLLASLSAHHISASSGSAFVDLLTTLGTPGSTAGQYAKTALTLMTAPSAQGSTAMSMLGINVGQLGALLQQKNGITAAAEYMKQQMQKFNPAATTLPVTEKLANGTSKILTGKAAAEYQLEKWTSGALPQAVINAWSNGNLAKMTAAQLGTTTAGANGTAVSGAQWQNTLQNLIVTKAFGGSRSSATIDALINNVGQISGIQSYIDTHSNTATYNKDLRLALNTPQAQLHRMEQSFMTSLIELGREITPSALSIGKVLAGLASDLLKFKFVLVPLVTVIAGLGITAGIAKGASVLQGGFGLIGRGYRHSNSWLSKLTGREINGGQWFQKFDTPADKMNRAADKMLEAASMGGGGIGKNLSNLIGENGEKIALSDAEKEVLSNGTVTKSAIRDAMVAKGEIGSYAESMKGEGLALVHGSYDKLTAIQSAATRDVTNVVSTATGDAVNVAEGAVKSASSILPGVGEMGAGDLLGSALGMAGGPLGMLAMSALTPMVMPMLTHALGGIFGSLFGNHNVRGNSVNVPGSKVPVNPNSLKALLLNGTAQMQNYEKQIANGTATSSAYASLAALTANMAAWRQDQKTGDPLWKSARTAQAQAKLWNTTTSNIANLKALSTRLGGLPVLAVHYTAGEIGKYLGPAWQSLPAREKSLFISNYNKSVKSGQSGLGQLAADFSAQIATDKTALSSRALLPYHYNALQARATLNSQWGNINLPSSVVNAAKKTQSGGAALETYTAYARAAVMASAAAGADMRELTKGHLGPEANRELKIAIAHLQARAHQDAVEASKIATKDKLTSGDRSAIAVAVADGFTKSANSLGLTSGDIQQAFVNAIGPGGFATLISKITKNQNAHPRA